jgi:outer membrane protein assembly factor BamB
LAEPPAAAPAPAPAAPRAQSAAGASATEALEAKYLVGPQLAEDFGLRVVWQTQPLSTKDAHGQAIGDSADSCWFGDSAGSVVRLRKDTGETVWRSSTNQGIERMVAIEHLPSGRTDNVYVMTELNSVTLDAVTGALIRKSDFSHLPSRLPAVFGPSMVYGTRTGLCCWFQYGTGYNWRATSLGGSVIAPVTVHGQVMLVGSTSGSVYAMDAATAGILWTRKLSAGIEAQIAADDEACYVAGIDQSVWAFDMQRGRVLWQHFTTSPLRNPPIRIADGLYVQIPGEGLVSFTPVPKDKPDGEVRWRSKAPGNVAMRLGGELFAWDQPTRTLTAIDAATGRVIREARLPRVDLIRFGSRIDGDVVVMSRDGLVERLEAMARPSAPAASASAAPAP